MSIIEVIDQSLEKANYIGSLGLAMQSHIAKIKEQVVNQSFIKEGDYTPDDVIPDTADINEDSYLRSLKHMLSSEHYWIEANYDIDKLKEFYLKLNLITVYRNNIDHRFYHLLKYRLSYMTDHNRLYMEVFNKYCKRYDAHVAKVLGDSSGY